MSEVTSLSFGEQGPLRPAHGGRELIDLRSDVDAGFIALEGKVSMPRITKIAGVLGAADGAASLVITGVNLLAGKVQASLVIGAGNAAVTFLACRPGEAGNDITIALVDPDANSQALAISVDGTDIVISLETGVAGAIATTAQDIEDAIALDEDAFALVSATAGGSGAGVVAAAAAENLAGGTGEGFVVYVAGGEVALDGPVSDTTISVRDGEADTLTEDDLAVVEVKSHTMLSSGITVLVVA